MDDLKMGMFLYDEDGEEVFKTNNKINAKSLIKILKLLDGYDRYTVKRCSMNKCKFSEGQLIYYYDHGIACYRKMIIQKIDRNTFLCKAVEIDCQGNIGKCYRIISDFEILLELKIGDTYFCFKHNSKKAFRACF